MPYLGDFLGLLLSEITVARMHSDLETVRIAELYASHPLLKTMPVPHLRLPDVDIDVPVLIKQSEEPSDSVSPRGGVAILALRQKFDQVLDAQLTRVGRPLAPGDRERLGVALDGVSSRLGQPHETAVDVNRIADEFTATALRLIAEPGAGGGTGRPPPLLPPTAVAEIKAAVRLEFLKLRKPPPRLLALVTSAEIRDAGGAENVTRLRLKVTEQGVEWTTIESEGLTTDRLIPE